MRPFTLDRAATAVEALRVAATAAPADAHVRSPVQYLAGGTQLFDLMKLDVMRPERLLDITGLRDELGRIEDLEDGLWLGALARMSDTAEDPSVVADFPAIRDALVLAASPQLRNMASLAGNVLQRTRCHYFRDRKWAACNKREPGSGCAARGGVTRGLAVLGASEHCIASYPGDLAVALVALDAEARLLGTDGRSRVLPLDGLHRLPGDTPHVETNLAPGDLITGFRVPGGKWTRRSRYVKVRDRASYAFALASAAVALELDGERVVTARIALGGVGAVPWRARDAERVLEGRDLTEDVAREAGEAAMAGAVGQGDNDFKIELGRRTVVRALLEAQAMEVRA